MRLADERKDLFEKLGSLCKGEMAAVESYDLALRSTALSGLAERLRWCETSHRERVELLSQHIRSRGGSPPSSSGAWGVFARTVESAAAILGRKAALSALEEGEDLGLSEYRCQTESLDGQSVQFVQRYLLPAQVETHRILRELKRAC
jgi:Domain of unknown function (DUF2383)